MSHLRSLLLLLGLTAAACAWAADELPPQKLAEIQLAQDQARAQVEKEFGNRPLSELTNEERGALIRATEEAAQEVFLEHGVSAKDFARQQTRLDREGLAAVEEAREALVAQQEAARAQAQREAEEKAAAEANREVEVIRAPSDENPVELFREEGEVQVERPTEEEVLLLRGEDAKVEEEKAPAPPKKRGKRRR